MKEHTTVGMDLGDQSSEVCVLDATGAVVERRTIANTKAAVVKFFTAYAGNLVAIETGTHSPWVSRALEGLGCEVLVGNARKLRAIWSSTNKSDVRDAEMLARIARMARSGMLEVLAQDYVRTARAAGVRAFVVTYKYALKNAAIPLVTIVGLEFGVLLGGAVITETIFAWPGVGRLAVDAIFSRDYPLVQAIVAMLATLFVVINLAMDLLYTYLDPRIAFVRSKQ